MTTKYCLPCGENGNPVPATVVIEGDPLCAGCARVAATEALPPETRFEPEPPPAAEPPAMCSRGCGEPTHRGLCKGQGGRSAEVRERGLTMVPAAPPDPPLPPAAAAPVPPPAPPEKSDLFVLRRVPRSQMPAPGAKVPAQPRGRTGVIWKEMLAAAQQGDEVVVVDFATQKDVGAYDRLLKSNARRLKARYGSLRMPLQLWCWLERAGARQEAA